MKEEYMRGALCVNPKEKVARDLDWNWLSVGGIRKESCAASNNHFNGHQDGR